MAKTAKLPEKFQLWVEARKRYHLSHAHIQMARELGMNPKKLGKKANHKQEPWKAPLPVFIEELYFKRFGKSRPEKVKSIEQIARGKAENRAKRRKQRQLERKEAAASATDLHHEQKSV